MRARLSGRRICFLAPRLDGYFVPIIAHAERVGAHVVGVITGSVSGDFPHRKDLAVADLSRLDPVRSAHRFEFRLSAPSERLTAWMAELDPSGEMLLVGNQFVEAGTLLGRAVFGWRRPAWGTWENKLALRDYVADIDVRLPPAIRVRGGADMENRVRSAARELDHGDGTVLAASGDNVDRGGGSTLFLWGRDTASPALSTWIAGRESDVLVARFVPGTSFSVHGIVLNGDVLIFDPTEIVCLLRWREGRVVFCGTSTYWRPAKEAGREMRKMTRAIGETMSGRDGFRGAFGVDGIYGDDGTVYITEVNARPSSGLGLREIDPDFPTFLMGRLFTEEDPSLGDLEATHFHAVIRATLWANPSASLAAPLGDMAPSNTTIYLDEPTRGLWAKLGDRLDDGRVRVEGCETLASGRSVKPTLARLTQYYAKIHFG